MDASGRVIRSLAEGWRPAGKFGVDWDGRTSRGMHASAGVYFVRAEVGGRSVTKRIVLLPVR